MRDILITGGAGKIGYDLVLKLLDTRYSVTVLDLESKESKKKLEKIKDKIKIVYGDVEDKNLITDLVKKNDVKQVCDLLDQGANIDAQGDNGNTSLITATLGGFTEMVKILIILLLMLLLIVLQ